MLCESLDATEGVGDSLAHTVVPAVTKKEFVFVLEAISLGFGGSSVSAAKAVVGSGNSIGVLLVMSDSEGNVGVEIKVLTKAVLVETERVCAAVLGSPVECGKLNAVVGALKSEVTLGELWSDSDAVFEGSESIEVSLRTLRTLVCSSIARDVNDVEGSGTVEGGTGELVGTDCSGVGLGVLDMVLV